MKVVCSRCFLSFFFVLFFFFSLSSLLLLFLVRAFRAFFSFFPSFASRFFRFVSFPFLYFFYRVSLFLVCHFDTDGCAALREKARHIGPGNGYEVSEAGQSAVAAALSKKDMQPTSAIAFPGLAHAHVNSGIKKGVNMLSPVRPI